MLPKGESQRDRNDYRISGEFLPGVVRTVRADFRCRSSGPIEACLVDVNAGAVSADCPSSGRGSPVAATCAPCRDGGKYWRPSPTPANERDVGPTVPPCLATRPWPAKSSPRRQDTLPSNPKTTPIPAATGSSKWCRIWCRDSRKVPILVPSGSHRTGIGRHQSAGQEAKTGRRKWRPAWELCDVMPSSITTSGAEGTGLEPATPYGAPHFQCAPSVT